jgi:eukaryotic-like serine/threonine-protein kinase
MTSDQSPNKNDPLKFISENAHRYQSQSKINEGGMKYIFEAHDKITNRKVATAYIKSNSSDQAIQQFINEAQITASLEHPNIVPVHDLGLSDEYGPFFTMKLLGGENLQDILEKVEDEDIDYLTKFSKAYLLEIFLKICDAIAFAHSKGIVHLDLKPANIQINEYGEVLVCDWGLARSFINIEDLNKIHDPSQLSDLALKPTYDGSIKGSPGFMAPEQISPAFGMRSIKTDIYCLGAILYSILTHRTPIEGSSLDAITKRTISKGIVAPKKRNPKCHISNSLNAVTLKAMSIEPKNRYASVNDLAHEIRAFTQGFATEAEHASFITQLNLLIKRNQRLCVLIMIFFSLICIITYSFMLSLQEEKEIALHAEKEAKKAQLVAQEADARSLIIRRSSAPDLAQYAQHQYLRHRYKSAKQLLEKALRSDPQFEDARHQYAYILFANHEFNECLNQIDLLKKKGALNWLKESSKLILKNNPRELLNSQLIHQVIYTIEQQNPSAFLQIFKTHFLLISTYKYPQNERLVFIENYLKKMVSKKFTFDLKTLSNKQLHLSLTGNKGIHDITVLNNLPISHLDLSHTDIDKIRSINSLPLTHLNLSHTHVEQLFALKNLPLKELNLWQTNVRSFVHLVDSPLEKLIVSGKWADLTPLKKIKSLKQVYVSRYTYSSNYLKQFDKSFKISFID